MIPNIIIFRRFFLFFLKSFIKNGRAKSTEKKNLYIRSIESDMYLRRILLEGKFRSRQESL